MSELTEKRTNAVRRILSRNLGTGRPGLAGATEVILQTAGPARLNLPRTLLSHGVASLPPSIVDGMGRAMQTTLETRDGIAFPIRISSASDNAVRLQIFGCPSDEDASSVVRTVRYMLRLDEDLQAFYKKTEADPDLAWAGVEGAGRMVRSPTVFEDVIKTICTTNCSWSATERMVTALVTNLGVPASSSPGDGQTSRAFPLARVLAEQPDSFFTEVMRAGYRGRYLKSVALTVAEGNIDLGQLTVEHPQGMTDDEVERRLLTLPGVGAYGAAHIMMLLGRSSKLVFDSWTLPRYRMLAGRPRVGERSIVRRFSRYREYAGLAFWLYLTRDWVSGGEADTTC